MLITLKILTDVYTEPDKNGNTKLIKRNIEYLKQFDSNHITIEQYIIPKTAKISKKYCIVKEDDKYYKANHKFEDLLKLNTHTEIKGFK